MRLKLDVKTLIAGFALGIIVTIAIGAGSGGADADRFGISVDEKGLAVVRNRAGDFFIVNPITGMAVRVLHARRLSDDAGRSRDSRGRIFNYNRGSEVQAGNKK